MTLPAPDPALALEAILDADHPIKTATADWAREHLDPGDMIHRDRESLFYEEAWRACAERGILGSTVSVDDGGRGDDIVTSALTLEGLGLGCRDNGLHFAISSQMMTVQEAIVRYGNTEQRQAILPGLCTGETKAVFAITEFGSGSDTFAMETVAEKDGDDYLLTGQKAHVTLGPVADVGLIFAKTNPDAGAWGISAFLVDLRSPGVEVTSNNEKMGLRTTPFGDITFDRCRVPSSSRVGPEGAGNAVFTGCMETERGLLFASHLGAAERVLKQAVGRANSRTQFGRSIGAFQAVSHRLADMAAAHESARLHMYRTAALLGRGERPTLSATFTKLLASEAIALIALDAAQVHGATGYVTSYEIEREVRDALGGLVYSGTSDIQRNLIARLIGVKDA